MAKEVLVTGAAGFIGRHVALRCVAAGWQVSTLDNRLPNQDVLGQTEFRRADLCDRTMLRAVQDGRFVAVLHHAGLSSTTSNDWSLLERANVTGPMRIAAACAVAGTVFVYASSHSVYGRIVRRIPIAEDADTSLCSGPLNLYAKSKLMLDNGIATEFSAGLRWIGMRYTNVFGPGEQHKGRMASIVSQLLRQAALGQDLQLFANTLAACRDYVPVDIVADTCVDLLRTPVRSGVYNCGSGLAVSFAEILEWCAELCGGSVTVRLVPNPMSERYQFWTCADMSKLNAALPNRQVITVEDVRLKAKTLFSEFQAERE